MLKKVLVGFLNNFEETVSATTLFVMFILASINALSRYIFAYTIPGVDEIISMCFTWTVFLGASACYKRNMHYGIDLLSNALPAKGSRVLTIFIHFLLLATCGYITYLAWKLSMTARTSRYTFYFAIPYFWIDISAVFGFAGMTVSTVRFLIRDLKGEKCGEPLVTDGPSDYEDDYSAKGGEEA